MRKNVYSSFLAAGRYTKKLRLSEKMLYPTGS